MLTIEKSKEMLNCGGLNYTDEEVKKIREFIYILAEIDYRLWERKHQEKAEQFQKENKIETEKQKSKTEPTEKNNTSENNNLKPTTNETQSHSIHPREYRRAS